MRITMDGLIRSLKGFAHDLAEDLEMRQARTISRTPRAPRVVGSKKRTAATERTRDERRR